MGAGNAAGTDQSHYRPALTGAEWNVLTTVLTIARDTGLQLSWTAEILQDFELLLRRRASGEHSTPTRQDLLNVADWRERIRQHRYRTPAFVRDRTVVDSVSVHFTAQELHRLIETCSAIGRRSIDNPQLRKTVAELCVMLQERPRSSTRKAIQKGLRPNSPHSAWVRAELASRALPLQQSLRKAVGAAADAAKRHGLG